MKIVHDHQNKVYPTMQLYNKLTQNEAMMLIEILGDIWAKFKKAVVEKKYDVQVTAFFYPDYQKKEWTVCGGFILNMAAADGWPDAAKKMLSKRFEDSAKHWVSEFDEILSSFVDDNKNGFAACKLAYPLGRREYRKILDEFLRSVNLIKSRRP